ncbi:MAG: radical SAM protein [Candidatus Hydrogenedentota bacterium]
MNACIQVTVGFESGSQRVLDTINKNATVEENMEAARMVHEAGLRVRGCFIVGTPGETREDVRLTEKFIKKAKVDFASVHYMTPMPGTALYDQFSERIEAENIGWEKFTCGDPDTINCNDAMDVAEQKMLYERLAARTALRNYTIPEMVKRSIQTHTMPCISPRN